jgi:hypothetical protein
MARKQRQEELPVGNEPGVASADQISIPEVEAAADKYIEIRDKRCKMTPREVTAKEELITLIHAHSDKIAKNAEGEQVYRYDDLIITLKPGKETLTIKEQTEPE